MGLRRILVLLLVLSGVLVQPAAEPYVLHLQEAVNMAQESSGELKLAGLSRQEIELQRQYLWNTWLPDIRFSTRAGLSSEMIGGFETSPFSFSGLALSASLQFSFPDDFEQELLELRSLQQEVSTERVRDQVVRSVARLYLSLQTGIEHIELAEVHAEIARESYESGLEAYEYGQLSELDLLQRELTSEQSRFEVVSRQAAYDKQRRAFLNALGVDPAETGELVLPDRFSAERGDRYLERSAAELAVDAADNSGTIAALELSAQQREIELTSTKQRSYLPSVTVSAEYNPKNFGSYPDTAQNDFTDYATLSVAVALPVSNYFKGSDAYLSVRTAERNIERSKIELEEAASQLESEITDAAADLRLARNQIDQARRALELQERVYESSRSAYEGGSISYSELQNSWSQTRDQQYVLLMREQAYHTQIVDLHTRIGGDPVELFTLVPE